MDEDGFGEPPIRGPRDTGVDASLARQFAGVSTDAAFATVAADDGNEFTFAPVANLRPTPEGLYACEVLRDARILTVQMESPLKTVAGCPLVELFEERRSCWLVPFERTGRLGLHDRRRRMSLEQKAKKGGPFVVAA